MNKILLGVSLLAVSQIAMSGQICTVVEDRFGDKQYTPGSYDATHISGSNPYSLIAHDLTEQSFPSPFTSGESRNLLAALYEVDLDHPENYIKFLTTTTYHSMTQCIDTKKVLFYGNNSAGRENIQYATRAGENTSSVNFKTSINFNGNRKTICDLHYGTGKIEPLAGCIDFAFTASLAEIDPELYRRLQVAQKELEILIKEGKEIDQELKGDIDKLNRAIRDISKKIFVEISESDFHDVTTLLDKYESLKLQINKLHEENKVLKSQFNQIYSEAAEDINQLIKNIGINIEAFSVPPEVKMSGLDINLQSLSFSSEFSSELYTDYAQATLNKLEDLYAESKNKEFIHHVRQWLNTSGDLKDTLDLHITASPNEWKALIKSFELVEGYIFSVVDRDLWFKDSPVTQTQRDGLESIRKVSPKWATIMENDLRQYRKANHTMDRENVLLTLEAMGNGLEGDGAENIDPNSFEETFAGMAEAIKEGTVCAAKVLALSDFGDFYEIVIGKDLCTGEELSVGERFVSVIGVAFGSARFWRYVAKTTGLISETRHFINLSSKLKDMAANMGMTEAQLQNMAHQLAKQYPCK